MSKNSVRTSNKQLYYVSDGSVSLIKNQNTSASHLQPISVSDQRVGFPDDM